MTRFAARSQEEHLLQDLLKLVESLHKSEQNSYSQFIEFGVMELVRRQMRQVAIEWQVQDSEELLRRAVAQVNDKLQERLAEHDLTFDFTSYFQNARQQLRYVAREIQELAEQLKQSGQQQEVKKEALISDGQVGFEVKEVGLREVEALIVTPLIPEYELDLDWLHQSHSVAGNWFPLYVTIEELGFVIDSDGTISISTENFPSPLLEKARSLMIALAHQLYWTSAN